jgi:hypothetical protein
MGGFLTNYRHSPVALLIIFILYLKGTLPSLDSIESLSLGCLELKFRSFSSFLPQTSIIYAPTPSNPTYIILSLPPPATE